MSNTTNKKQKDILNTQTNVEENQNKENSTLIVRERIPNTPFYIIRNLENQWFIVMGDHRITELKETKEEALDELEDNRWFITMSIAAIVLEKMLAEKKYWKETELDKDIKKFEPVK